MRRRLLAAAFAACAMLAAPEAFSSAAALRARHAELRQAVGFTVVGREDGRELPIVGMRGLVERNTMRYHLAIEAFLFAQSLPREARREKSLRDWFAASARHPRQLHEVSREEYLAMKRGEQGRP